MNSLLAHIMLLNYITGTTNYTESYYLLTNSEAYIVVLNMAVTNLTFYSEHLIC